MTTACVKLTDNYLTLFPSAFWAVVHLSADSGPLQKKLQGWWEELRLMGINFSVPFSPLISDFILYSFRSWRTWDTSFEKVCLLPQLSVIGSDLTIEKRNRNKAVALSMKMKFNTMVSGWGNTLCIVSFSLPQIKIMCNPLLTKTMSTAEPSHYFSVHQTVV